jgi:hypothetical protein
MDDFISDDDLRTFDGWLRYQAVDPARLTPDELEMWRGYFVEAKRRSEDTPKVGLMKLPRVPGEQKYAVAIRDGSDLWLTMWVRCSRTGEVFVMYPGGKPRGDAHASYHRDGTFHQKGNGGKFMRQKRQPLTAAFKGSEHLGGYGGHGKSTGAICDPNAFDGVVIVEPGILGPKHGSVVVDLVEPLYEPKRDLTAHQRQVFPRGNRPSVVITIAKGNEAIPFLRWPDDFVKVEPNSA